MTVVDFADAVDFAAACHSGQRTKIGEAYILHPIRVSLAVKGAGFDRRYQAAGVLHDVVEDCEIPPELLYEKYGPEVGMAVESVTRVSQNEPYEEFVARAAEHPIGKWIKYFDLRDNLGRIDELSDWPDLQKRLMDRYTRALVFLQDRGVCL